MSTIISLTFDLFLTFVVVWKSNFRHNRLRGFWGSKDRNCPFPYSQWFIQQRTVDIFFMTYQWYFLLQSLLADCLCLVELLVDNFGRERSVWHRARNKLLSSRWRHGEAHSLEDQRQLPRRFVTSSRLPCSLTPLSTRRTVRCKPQYSA